MAKKAEAAQAAATVAVLEDAIEPALEAANVG